MGGHQTCTACTSNNHYYCNSLSLGYPELPLNAKMPWTSHPNGEDSPLKGSLLYKAGNKSGTIPLYPLHLGQCYTIPGSIRYLC